MKRIDDTVVDITIDNFRVTHSKDISTGKEYNAALLDFRSCNVANRMYVPFVLESIYTVSQLKYSSKYNSTKSIFDTLRENHAFLK